MLAARLTLYYTYIIYSGKFDKIYIGHTDNIEFRLARHNMGLVKSTKSYAPWQLIGYEKYPTRAKAMKREKELKSHKGRDYVRQVLLNQNNLDHG